MEPRKEDRKNIFCYKKDKRNIWIFIIIIVFGFVSAYYPTLFGKPTVNYKNKMKDSVMSFHVIDVGQGSATLLKTEEKAVLIDVGEYFNAKMLTDYLKADGIEKLDIVVATHPDSDHYGAIPKVLKQFSVENVFLPLLEESQIPDNKTWEKLMVSLAETDAVISYKSKKETFPLGNGIEMELLGPFLKGQKDLNNISLCFKITVGEADFLITGDGAKAVEKALIQNENIDADVLVVGHHGSSSSSTPKFLSSVDPKFSAISVGEGNSYGLPNEDVVNRLLAFGKVFRTDKDGSIVFLTDGVNIGVMTENNPNGISFVAA